MAIVHMNKRIERFLNQLDLHDDILYPDPQLFDYNGGQEIWRYDEEVTIDLPDFQIYFGLVVEQKGTYTPAEYCQPEEFNPESTEVEIEDLNVWDHVYGEDLRFSREEFTEVINKVRELISI